MAERETVFHLSERYAEQSHEDIRRALEAAIGAGGMVSAPGAPYLWICDVYDDYFIYRSEGPGLQTLRLYRRDYSIADDGTVTLGDPQPVKEVTTYEPVTASDPDWSWLYAEGDPPADAAPSDGGPTKTFLERLRQLLRDSVSVEEWNAAVASARGHAGGKARAAARSASDLPTLDPARNQDDIDVVIDMLCADAGVTLTPAERKAVKAQLLPRQAGEPAPVEFAAAGNVARLIATFGKWAGGSEATCATKLAGKVANPDRLCAWLKDQWKGNTYWRGKSDAKGAAEAVAEIAPGWRLFSELAFAEAPEWIPYLPVPGTYKHPRYGDVKITKSRNKAFVDNFTSGVYQPQIPIDAEHDVKASGAVGWITEMRQNADGSVDARVDWNDRGRSMIEGDRFKFFSPEWYESWSDPITGTVHSDVAIGGALTTKPFFKPGALRPLVASEGALLAYAEDPLPGSDHAPGTATRVSSLTAFTYAAEDAAGSEEAHVAEENTTPQTPQAPVGMTEEQAQAFAELQAKVDAAEQARQASEEVARKAAEEVQAIRREQRALRFTDVVMGRGGEGDGARWTGDVSTHVAMMEDLADRHGEESDLFRHYVAMNQSAAAQRKASRLFSAIGSDLDGDPSLDGRLAAEAAKFREADPQLTADQAIERALEAKPELYDEYLANKPK